MSVENGTRDGLNPVKLFFIYLFIFILTISIVTATNNYTEAGTYDNDFILGTGFFNSQITDVTKTTRTITTPRQMPYVADLDNDGTNEIIILDGTSIRLYEGSLLNIIDSYTLPSEDFRDSNLIVFDIDSDNKQEVIIALAENKTIQILEYNGTSFFQDIELDITTTAYNDGELLIKCVDSENACMLFFTYDEDLSGGENGRLGIAYFDWTTINPSVKLYESSLIQRQLCFPRIKTASVGDYDNDGADEVVVTLHHHVPQDAKSLKMFYVGFNGANISSEGSVYVDDVLQTTGGLTESCQTSEAGNIISNPLLFNADGASSNGLETIVGYMVDDDEFEMKSFDKDGNELDIYPEIFQADGEIVSNLVRANIFTDTDDDDFCLMGYDADEDEIDLLCASMVTGETPQTREFKADISTLYNVSTAITDWHNIIHSAQHSTATTDNNNLNEIISSYGVHAVDWNDVYTVQVGANIFTLDLIYESPVEDTALLSVDAENVGREDLIALSSTNVWYINDGFTNSNGEISSYTVNPCIDSTWKINGTAEARITVTDSDSDTVRARAILYYNNDNQQDSGWSSYSSSGATFPFTFDVNETVSAGTLRLIGQDSENPTVNDTIDLTFSVSSNGVSFGDCITDVTIEDEEVTTTAGNATLGVNDSITTTLQSIKDSTGLQLNNNTIWLVIMAIVGIMMWVGAKNSGFSDPVMAFGAIALVEVILVILGVVLGYFSVAIIFILVIIALAIIAIKLRTSATGG